MIGVSRPAAVENVASLPNNAVQRTAESGGRGRVSGFLAGTAADGGRR